MTVELKNGSRVHQSGIKLQYNWWLGEVGSRFYKELRDRCKIVGIKCPECRRIYVPPYQNCPNCFSKMSEWVDLEGTGTLVTYTIVRYSVPAIQPLEVPFGLGIIKLEGADTGFTHVIGEVDLEKLRIGMKLKPVFREARKGHLLDIKYFKPV